MAKWVESSYDPSHIVRQVLSSMAWARHDPSLVGRSIVLMVHSSPLGS